MKYINKYIFSMYNMTNHCKLSNNDALNASFISKHFDYYKGGLKWQVIILLISNLEGVKGMNRAVNIVFVAK